MTDRQTHRVSVSNILPERHGIIIFGKGPQSGGLFNHEVLFDEMRHSNIDVVMVKLMY